MINDADAAGMAEMEFGAGRGVAGTVLMLTFGTGIGSALFTDGTLVPNTEFGHIQMHGTDAEKRASDHARERHGLSWEKWAARVDEYLRHMEALLSPRADHHRRRGEQEVGQVRAAADRRPGEHRHRGHAQRRRDRRRGHARLPRIGPGTQRAGATAEPVPRPWWPRAVSGRRDRRLAARP